MDSTGSAGWKTGLVWAALMLAAAALFPSRGAWTIDDSVKRIAAEQGRGVWAETVDFGPLRQQAVRGETADPLRPPFAVHEADGLHLGFAPLTRAVFKQIRWGGEWAWRLAPALLAVVLWGVLARSGFGWGFLLLPLTFYGLTPWEHVLSWILVWPLLWMVCRRDRERDSSLAAAFGLGGLAAAAILLRPETAILCGALAVYEVMEKRYDRAGAMSLGLAAGLAVFALAHRLTAGDGAWVQIGLNLKGATAGGSALDWLAKRPQAFYELLLRMDAHPWASVLLLVITGSGAWLVMAQGESSHKLARGLGLGLLMLSAGLVQYRLWSSALPVLTVMAANSLILSLPWVMLLLKPPYRGRPAFWIGLACVGIAILTAPVWEGVHWGPRILLFALPVLMIDLYQSKRAQGWAFAALLGVTLIHTMGSATLVYARSREISDRNRLLETKLGSPVICPTMSQCADLAPLWSGREFFTAATPRELKQLLIDFRFARVDTVWLHLDAFDPLYVQAFPKAKPVWPYRMTVIQAGSLYKTPWRVYELVMNRADSGWVEVLENEAGQLMLANKPEQALRLEEDAVTLAPQAAKVHHNLALILAGLGRRDDARREAEAAMALDPSLAEPRRLLDMLDGRTGSVP
jgi:hypothetical protein